MKKEEIGTPSRAGGWERQKGNRESEWGHEENSKKNEEPQNTSFFNDALAARALGTGQKAVAKNEKDWALAFRGGRRG